jgi:hypothetical protein
VALNPARIPVERRGAPDVEAALARLAAATPAGLARLTELGHVDVGTT